MEKERMEVHGYGHGFTSHGLMPKDNPCGHLDWLSRDYADIDCKAFGCVFNKDMKCSVPSLCTIGGDGRCTGFMAAKQKETYDGD